MIVEKIITGGQTGADQAGWRAAKAAGIPTGGWMPLDFLTEAGNRPEFAELYGAKEWPELALTVAKRYRERTILNVQTSDATVIFTTNEKSRGTVLAYRTAYRWEKPSLVVKVDIADLYPTRVDPVRPTAFAGWLRENKVKVLNVAGNRESHAPGIGKWVEAHLSATFIELGVIS